MGDAGDALVVQMVSGWDDWPDDVRDRLRAWNAAFLLSFRRGPDFRCGGCRRRIRSHPNGNPVVRSHRKAHGVLRCEDCLIALARAHERPPQKVAPRRRRTLESRLRGRIAALEARGVRLRQQVRIDHAYAIILEAEITPRRLAEIHAELRGRDRRARCLRDGCPAPVGANGGWCDEHYGATLDSAEPV